MSVILQKIFDQGVQTTLTKNAFNSISVTKNRTITTTKNQYAMLPDSPLRRQVKNHHRPHLTQSCHSGHI